MKTLLFTNMSEYVKYFEDQLSFLTTIQKDIKFPLTKTNNKYPVTKTKGGNIRCPHCGKSEFNLKNIFTWKCSWCLSEFVFECDSFRDPDN